MSQFVQSLLRAMFARILNDELAGSYVVQWLSAGGLVYIESSEGMITFELENGMLMVEENRELNHWESSTPLRGWGLDDYSWKTISCVIKADHGGTAGITLQYQ